MNIFHFNAFQTQYVYDKCLKMLKELSDQYVYDNCLRMLKELSDQYVYHYMVLLCFCYVDINRDTVVRSEM